MKIEVLYFEGCPNHPPAVELAKGVVAELGVDASVEVVEVKSEADAKRFHFFGSPTIQVDGVDIEPEARARTDFSFSCRMYGGAGLPPREMIVAAITGEGPGASSGESPSGGGASCCSEQEDTTGGSVAFTGSDRVGLLAAGGSVLTAVVASACCWLPLLLILFGLSAGGVSAWFAAWRPVFLVVAVVLLGLGFYLVYVRKAVCEPGSTCAVPNRKLMRFNRGMIWVATVFVVAFAFFPSYAGYFVRVETPEAGAAEASGQTLKIEIDQMTCKACAVHAHNELAKVPGVLRVAVSYADSQGVVVVDATSPPSSESLVSAVERAGYKVTGSIDGL